VCTRCWLAQLREVIPDGELYGDQYGFRTGSSPGAVRYFGDMAAELLTQYPYLPSRLTVEIACNDGTFLREIAAAGGPVLGVEPVKPAAEQAREGGLDVIAEPFTAALARDIRTSYGAAGMVVACNVAAHVADPADFLGGARILLGAGGVLVAEFQDLEKLIAGCQADHVYHEHRFFYSLRSFARLAQSAGLAVTGWVRTRAQGGSLRVTLARMHGFIPDSSPWLESWEPYASMQDRALYLKMRLLDLIDAERDEGRVVAGYGASAKSATLLNWCGVGPVQVPWVEDITPGKIGRFTPGGHIPIRAPGRAPDTYLLTAWNYLPDVIRRPAIQDFLDVGGRMIVPGPVPVLI